MSTAEPISERDAYALLSKPTLELTDAEVEIVVAELRKKRSAYVHEGKKDNATSKRKPAATAADKDAATKALLADLDLDLGL